MRAFAVLLTALLAAPGAGCGQKGPLYLREAPPHGQQPARAEPYRPVPYPPASREEEPPARK